MQSTNLPKVAVIADAHLHDMHSNYDGVFITLEDQPLCLRSWKDTRRSSRVFNESRMALTEALESIRSSGISFVVLLGDYSDDGQIESIDRVVDILRHYQQAHGIVFFSIPGNHDYYGPAGKHQSTRFAISAEETVLVTSDPDIAKSEPDSAVVSKKMYCPGAVDALQPMAEFGLFRQKSYLHWETPFGLNDKLDSRVYTATSADDQVSYSLTDASYLVEPSPGLWLLLLDANVFEPRNGQWDITQKKAFLDSSDAGWNAVVQQKRHLMNWIRDVCKRSEEQGKCLLAFSHYPAIDPYNDTHGGYEKLFGATSVKRRQPNIDVAKQLLDAGLKIHFGGHMHVNSTSQFYSNGSMLTNIAVPSPVAFPPAYQVVQAGIDHCDIETVSLGSLKLDPRLMDFYTAENAASDDAFDVALSSTNYGEFLYKRIYARVLHRYFIKDWPAELVSQVKKTTAADLFYLLHAQALSSECLTLRAVGTADDSSAAASMKSLAAKYELDYDSFASHALLEWVADWYCLRDASSQVHTAISAEKLKRYQCLSEHFGDATLPVVTSHAEFFTVFLGMMQGSLADSHHATQSIPLTHSGTPRV